MDCVDRDASRSGRCEIRGWSERGKPREATVGRCGTGLGGAAKSLGAGEGLTGAATTGSREILAGGSFGMLSSKDAVSVALQLVMRGCPLRDVRALILTEIPATLGTQRPSVEGFSPDGQGLLQVLSG